MLRSILLSTLLCLSSMTVQAWTTGSAVSSFGGSVLISQRPETTNNHNQLVMKKGKANVPVNMRGNYKKQMEMEQMRKQMVQASQAGSDGLPVFNLYVRTTKANMWYPCGSFKGDERSAALSKSFADDGLLAGISKKQLDGGVAGSVFRDLEKLKESICRTYPQLRKSRDELEFGYKLAFEGLSKEKADEMNIVEPKEQKGLLDNVKNMFSG